MSEHQKTLFGMHLLGAVTVINIIAAIIWFSQNELVAWMNVISGSITFIAFLIYAKKAHSEKKNATNITT